METMDGLREFIYVAENTGFSSAAKALKVSKSHISKQVNKLENDLQVRLLNRTTRKITLTDAGRALYERSKHIFNELDDIYNEITQTQKQASGTLKISVAGAFAEEYLSEIFTSFMKENSKIKIELHFSERMVDLVNENFDLAIRYGQLDNSSLISKKIGSRREYICASPKYIEKCGMPLRPSDLTSHNCLVGNNDKWVFTHKNKQEQIKVSGNWKSNNGRALTTAAKNDLGIAKLPGAYIISEIKNGELICLLDDFTNAQQDIWLLYPQKKFLPHKIRSLIDYVSFYLEENYSGLIF